MGLTRDRTYFMAVGLSAASAVLGLGRELYLLAMLGFGPRNDALQLCLSITYTISLFNEPVRLAGLNLLGVRLPRRQGAGLAAAVVAVAVVVTVSLGRALPASPWWWIPCAFLAGLANLGVAALLPYYQRHGPFLRVHAVTTIPNFLILSALAGLALSGRADPVPLVPVLFLAAPMAQLAAFAVLRRMVPAAEVDGRWAGWGEIASHGLVASGTQMAQIGLRTALAGVPGLLSVFVIALRSVDTVRAVLVDTYIATRVRRWAEANEREPRSVAVPHPAIIGLALAAGAVALALPVRAGVAAILAGGTLLTAWTRIQYHRLNTARAPRRTILRVAAVEVATAGLVFAGATAGVAPVGLVAVGYLARPLGLVSVLRRGGMGGLTESEIG